MLNALVSGWAATLGTFDQTIDLFAFALGTVWLFDNRAVQKLFFFVAILTW